MALTDAQLDAIRVRVTETAKLYTGGLRPGQAARDRAVLLAEVDRLRAEAAPAAARKNAARWLAEADGEARGQHWNALHDVLHVFRLHVVTGYVSSCLDEGDTPVLDETWATREAVLTALERLREEEQERADLWSGAPGPDAADYAQQALDEVARIDALRQEVASGG